MSAETAGAQSKGRRGIGSEANLGTVARGGGLCLYDPASDRLGLGGGVVCCCSRHSDVQQCGVGHLLSVPPSAVYEEKKKKSRRTLLLLLLRERGRICLVVNDLPSAESKGAVPVRRGPPSECARAHLAPDKGYSTHSTLLCLSLFLLRSVYLLTYSYATSSLNC